MHGRSGDSVVRPSPEEVLQKENAIQRMYDTRKDFVESANRYYTRYLVAFAGIGYSLKYAVLDTNNAGQTAFLLICSSLLCVVGAFLVIGCKQLLRSLYYLYSSSTVTAATKALSVGDWDHAWFDSVYQTAQALDSGEPDPENPTWKGWWIRKTNNWDNWGLGIKEPRPNRCSLRERLANRWASKPLSLLGINSVIHDLLAISLVLIATCLFLGGVVSAYQATQDLGQSSTSDTLDRQVHMLNQQYTNIETSINNLDDTRGELASIRDQIEAIAKLVERPSVVDTQPSETPVNEQSPKMNRKK